MKPTAAAKSAALLRQLDDANRQRDGLRHVQGCSGGPLVTQKGFSVTTTRCETCKAVASVRHGAT
jgi:putative AlgH/UPF0301 family transcriptional regulator